MDFKERVLKLERYSTLINNNNITHVAFNKSIQ